MKLPAHLLEYFQDISLCTAFKTHFRKDRVTAWTNHVNAFKALKAHLVLPALLGTDGIDFVAGHLDILDRKLGSLLTFHGMAATVVGLYLNVFLSGRVGQLSGWFWAFGFVWIANTLLCLLAMAWVPWGNLGDKPTLWEAEEKQIEGLITSVVIRTALFRLAVPLTAIWLLLFACTAWTTKNVTDKQLGAIPCPIVPKVSGASSAKRTELLAIVGPFASGVGCSLLPLEHGIQETVSGIQRVNPTRVQLVGLADAQSLGHILVKEFGSNTGLAMTRARCVAGWLTQALAPRTIQLELTAHDAVDRSPKAMKYGSPIDRTVQVLAIP
jgi:MFS family permease